MTINITWLLIRAFTIVTLDMDSALHVEYSDVVPCGAFVDINNYPMDGLATIINSTSLLRNLNYKQPHQIMPIWNGFHEIVLVVRGFSANACMDYLLLIVHVLKWFHFG